MRRIDVPTAVGSPPTPDAPGTEGYFTVGSPGVTPATVVSDDFLNMVQEEILAVVDAASIAHSKTTYTQLRDAIRFLIGDSLPGVIGGLTMANNGTDAVNDIDFAVGAAASADATTILRAAAMTKRLDANWVAGSGNGGLGNGLTKTASTWYHCFVANKTDGGVDFGYDTSPVATNLLVLTGGSKYRMIGSILTDAQGTPAIVPFKQRGHWFFWTTPPRDINVSNLTTARTLYPLSVPPDVMSLAHVRALIGPGDFTVLLGSPDEADVAPDAESGGGYNSPLATFFDNAASANTLQATLDIFTNTSKQIAARSDAASTTLVAVTLGYEHPRGRW